jgi:hypothetical protein
MKKQSRAAPKAGQPAASPAEPASPAVFPSLLLSEDDIFRDPFADFAPSSR